MLNDLKEYYESERQYLREMGALFADRYPKIASRLGLSAEGVRDPHAERIVQGVALLNARIRKKLDDDFPELVEAMLDLVYPHFLRPFPSTGIAAFQLDSLRGDPTSVYEIPSGKLLETSQVGGHELTYRTCGDLKLWPVKVQQAAFMVQPFHGVLADVAAARSVLRIQIQSHAPSIPVSQIGIDELRFFLHLPPLSMAAELYELLMEDVIEVVLSSPRAERRTIRLGPRVLEPGRRSDAESLLPESPRTFSGYRILTEQFASPESFLFVKLTDLANRIPVEFGSDVTIDIFFSRENRELARNVNRSSIQLGAVPVINLFPTTSTDVPVSELKSEFRIIPDAQREKGIEIYSILDVAGVQQDGNRVPIRPFFSSPHGVPNAPYWHSVRRPVPNAGAGADQVGYDQWISLADLSLSGELAFDRLQVDTICFNRNVPNSLHQGGALPDLKMSDGSRAVDVSFLTRPTSTRRPPTRDRAYWDLIANLSLNYLSLEPRDPYRPEAFRNLLKLYEHFSDRYAQQLSRGVRSLSCRPDVAILPEVIGGFCRGVEVTLELDEDVFVGNSAYLFAMAVEEFLCRYVSVNSFSRLIAMTTSMAKEGRRWRWKPRSGTRALL
ncbi:MAG: type VI secretion system baseplate subunit TssF [Planctomycetaceae bacterium]|nr:type VI secretion system baseplate subunit TssF [Planctomycetaceae bacterium]